MVTDNMATSYDTMRSTSRLRLVEFLSFEPVDSVIYCYCTLLLNFIMTQLQYRSPVAASAFLSHRGL